MSVNDGDFRVAVPPNPGTVRIRVGFTDCGESSGTAGSAGSAGSATFQPPILLLSIVFGLPGLVLPRGVRQISTGSKLLSAVLSGSRALHLHRLSILYEPTVRLTGSDSCLIVISASLYLRDYRCRRWEPLNPRHSTPSVKLFKLITIIAWGCEAAIVGVTGIALPCSRSDSYINMGLPVSSSSGVPNLSVAIAA